jgi:phosphoribosylformimino-5-aminoimidazole carboxamide ribotide isomerase
MAPGLAVIASGGVGSLDDIAAVSRLNVEAVIVGRALYDNRFTYREAAAVCEQAV